MPISLKSINPMWAQLRASPSDRYEAGRSQRNAVALEAHTEVPEEAQRALIPSEPWHNRTKAAFRSSFHSAMDG